MDCKTNCVAIALASDVAKKCQHATHLVSKINVQQTSTDNFISSKQQK